MQDKYKRRRHILIYVTGSLVVFAGILVLVFYLATRITPPVIKDMSATQEKITSPSPGFSYLKNNWLRKNKYGLWEMYIEGSPFERGVYEGKLSANLMRIQERAFTGEISRMVPSNLYRHFLKYFIYWFNRNLDRNITDEDRKEIYGISLSASDEFSVIGSNYHRILNYHSAHDIGHALQDLRLVGCTSFGVWADRSKDSSLIIGRNFDFYVGDAFAENKIVCFEHPDSGYAFMTVTWGGMIGAVSGMNEKGLTVTINAAKSSIPWSARTPISLLAREILQYASDISEAWAIAEKRRTFVSESILIGSAADHKAAVIEKSPFKMSLREPSGHYIICTNHFLSAPFLEDPLNKKDMKESPSVYRYKRVLQEITDESPLDPVKAAGILRDRDGLNGKDIGMGNEKAINQLIAHHSIIFEPEKRRVWISTNPWQLGSYVCYDISKIFHSFAGLRENREIAEPGLTIPADSFMETAEYRNYLDFRDARKEAQDAIREGSGTGSGPLVKRLMGDNPSSFETYELAGDLYRQARPDSSVFYYRKALGKEIPRKQEKDRIIRKLAGVLSVTKQLEK